MKLPKGSRLNGVWLLFFPILGILMAILTVTGLPNFSLGSDQPDGNMIAIGKPAPDFTGTTLDGRQIQLSNLKGSIVAISFWASWCEPCKAEMPELQNAVLSYSDARLVVLAVNAGEDKSLVSSFAKEYNITLPILLDPDKAIFKRYHVPALPITVWIDSKGVVRAEQIGPLDHKLIASYIELLSRTP